MNALYHYTSELHLPHIRAAGFLETTESNIGSPSLEMLPYGEHIGPDVVWLTDVPDVRNGHGLNTGLSGLRKTAVRFSVMVSDAIPWAKFAHDHGINRRWFAALDASGGGTARHWWVCPRRIYAPEWQSVILTSAAPGPEIATRKGRRR